MVAKRTSFGASEIREVSAKPGKSGGCKEDLVLVEKLRVLRLFLIRKKGFEAEPNEETVVLKLKFVSICRALLSIVVKPLIIGLEKVI